MLSSNIIDIVLQNFSKEVTSDLNSSEYEFSESNSTGNEKKFIGSNYTIGKKIYILILK